MKKFISVILLGAVLALSGIAGCSSQKETGVDYSKLEVKKDAGMGLLRGYNDLAELEKLSELIVIGTFVDDSRSEIELGYDKIMGTNIMSDMTSYNTMKISKVIKGDVNIGDEIEISQYYVVEDGELYTFSGMTPMIKGDSWLFFLAKSNRDNATHYCHMGDFQGRYPIPDTENTVLPYALDNGTYDPEDFRSDIYSEILEKYEF